MVRRMAGVVCVLVALCAAQVRAEQMDNPAYQNWAKFKPGTSVKQKMETEAAGQKTVIEMTTTLKELTPEKAVLEVVQAMEAAGQKMDMPAQKMEVAAKIEKPTDEQAKEAEKVKAQTKQGEEDVEVAGKKVKAKWAEVTVDAQGQKVTTKTWQSEEIPGMLVKMESSSDGEPKMSTKMAVTEIKTP